MNWNQENMKKLMLLITFTVLLLVGVQRLDVVLGAVGFLWNICWPFALGGAMAFVLNVPMSALEKKWFPKKDLPGHKLQGKLARPLSLAGALVLVCAVIAVVIFVVVPELSATFGSLGSTVEAFLPKAQVWLEELFDDNQQITAWLETIELN